MTLSHALYSQLIANVVDSTDYHDFKECDYTE